MKRVRRVKEIRINPWIKGISSVSVWNVVKAIAQSDWAWLAGKDLHSRTGRKHEVEVRWCRHRDVAGWKVRKSSIDSGNRLDSLPWTKIELESDGHQPDAVCRPPTDRRLECNRHAAGLSDLSSREGWLRNQDQRHCVNGEFPGDYIRSQHYARVTEAEHRKVTIFCHADKLRRIGRIPTPNSKFVTPGVLSVSKNAAARWGLRRARTT